MNILLDTHTLLWAVLQPKNLSTAATAILENPENEVLVSAACAWEISTKVKLKK